MAQLKTLSIGWPADFSAFGCTSIIDAALRATCCEASVDRPARFAVSVRPQFAKLALGIWHTREHARCYITNCV